MLLMNFRLGLIMFYICLPFNLLSQISRFEKRYDTLGTYYGNYVRETIDQGIIFCGSSYNNITTQDAVIIKLDSQGLVIWAKKYGGFSTDGAISLEVLPDSTYLIFGIKDLINVNQTDAWEI